MKNLLVVLGGLLGLMATQIQAAETNKPPVRLAIIGLVHTHVRGFLPSALANPAVAVVGIVDAGRELAAQIALIYKLNTNLFYASIEELLAKTNVQAVATFTGTFDHLRVVEASPPHGIHVMMEKPLAVNMEHARAMAATKILLDSGPLVGFVSETDQHHRWVREIWSSLCEPLWTCEAALSETIFPLPSPENSIDPLLALFERGFEN